MTWIIGTLFLLTGVIGVWRPEFFIRVDLLPPEKTKRSKRVWKKCGTGLIVLGILELAMFWIN